MKEKGSEHFFDIILYARVRAGVLQLTLGISVIISVLCASMILLVYYTRLEFLQQDIDLKLRNNSISGIYYMMSLEDVATPFNEAKTIDLFGDETDSVSLIRKPWGVFEMVSSTAVQGRHHASQAAMVGYVPNETGKSVLYIPDNNAPVYLAGDVLLKGTVYASARKFSSGYIDGRGYKRDRFVQGDLRKSASHMPTLDTTLLTEIKSIMRNRQSAYRTASKDRLPVNEQLSFCSSETLHYFSSQSIDLIDSLQGNLIIQSAIKIRVTAEARLSDVILVAPDIDIDKGFSGSVQCFAERSITVGAESTLKFPSALVLLGQERDSTIVIQRDAVVHGYVIIPGYGKVLGSRGTFKVDEKAIFHGMAYVNGASDIQGKLYGHLTTRTTQVKVGSTIYGNYILNGEINAVKRSAYLPAISLWGHSDNLVIAKWTK